MKVRQYRNEEPGREDRCTAHDAGEPCQSRARWWVRVYPEDGWEWALCLHHRREFDPDSRNSRRRQ
jgi:hypothetical protein